MSINTGDNFRYQGKKYLDDRQSFKTLAELMTYTNVPPGFIAYCEENGERYEYVNDTWILYKVSTDTGDLDLSDYALKTDVPTKTSELENDSGFVTQEHNHNANDIEGLDSAINEALNGASGGTSHVHSNLTTLERISDEDINNWNNKSDFSGSYNELTNKPVIPTVPKHISAFINDAGYISELPDMSNYVTKDETHSHDNKATLDKLTEEKMTSWDNKSNFSGNYNDLSNKPITPTKTSQLINDSGFVTSNNIQNIDLDNYATKAELPTKLSQLENDSGYLKEADIHTHENKDVLDSITVNKINKWDNPSYNDLANKPYIPDKVSDLTNDLEFVTREYMQNYIPDSSGGEIDLSGYVTKETGNANQITFSDGQTFQAKLDAGTLKGDKGDPGVQGLQGQDGLTTQVSVNGTTYTHTNGLITLPDYPAVPTKTSDLTNDSDFATNASVDFKISNINTGEITDLSNYQKKTDDTLKTTDKTIIGAINEIYDMLVEIIGGQTDGIVSTSYDETTGNLVLTASNGATITYNEATGNLSITNSSTTYDSATGNINIK